MPHLAPIIGAVAAGVGAATSIAAATKGSPDMPSGSMFNGQQPQQQLQPPAMGALPTTSGAFSMGVPSAPQAPNVQVDLLRQIQQGG